MLSHLSGLGAALLLLAPQPVADPVSAPDRERAAAFRTCLDEGALDNAAPLGDPTSLPAALQSRSNRGRSDYRSMGQGLYRYHGIQGQLAFCGIIFTGPPSPRLLAAVGEMAPRMDMIPSPLSLWTLGEPSERKWRYWGRRHSDGGSGILVSSHRLADGTEVTEIDYHDIAIL